MMSLMINEVYRSIQGESTWAGLPCVFVRLTGCHLRCHYCDSEYAFYEGSRRSIEDLIEQVRGFDCNLVEVTGGEPLLQPGVHGLMAGLCDIGLTVLLETSGACDVSVCDPRVIKIMDIKTPGSGEADKNLWSNIDQLSKQDEVKFVICGREDYLWAREVIAKYSLADRVKALLMSAAAPIQVKKEGEISGVQGVKLEDLAKWILDDHLPVRFQVQLHKVVWEPSARGV